MEEKNFLEDILAQLKNDSESKNLSKLKKIIMNSPEVVGSTINALPIVLDGKIYYKLDAVREFRTTSKFFREGDQETWVRLLDRSAYGNLNEIEVELWKKTKDALEQLIESVDNYYAARFRRYTLIPVYITKFITVDGVENPDMKGVSLLIFPSHAPIKAMDKAFKAMSTSSGGNQWMPLVLSPTLKGREGVLSISFSKSTSNMGYDCAMSVIMNNQWNKIVDSNINYSEDTEFNPIREFLAWEASDDKLFRSDVIEEFYNTIKTNLDNSNKSNQGTESNNSDNINDQGIENNSGDNTNDLPNPGAESTQDVPTEQSNLEVNPNAPF